MLTKHQKILFFFILLMGLCLSHDAWESRKDTTRTTNHSGYRDLSKQLNSRAEYSTFYSRIHLGYDFVYF